LVKTENGISTITPAISQWPVVVSFPAERSFILPKLARCGRAKAFRVQEYFSSRTLGNPRAQRLGSQVSRHLAKMLPSVFAPSPQYRAAWGAGQIPTKSKTIKSARMRNCSGGLCPPKTYFRISGHRPPLKSDRMPRGLHFDRVQNPIRI